MSYVDDVLTPEQLEALVNRLTVAGTNRNTQLAVSYVARQVDQILDGSHSPYEEPPPSLTSSRNYSSEDYGYDEQMPVQSLLEDGSGSQQSSIGSAYADDLPANRPHQHERLRSSRREMEISWNEQLQAAFANAALPAQSEILTNLAHDFIFVAKGYGSTIISEFGLIPELRTIMPAYGLGGQAGGEKYDIQGVMFKFSADIHGIYGSDGAAMKAAGHELKGLVQLQRVVAASGSNLSFPMIALVDYLGFRLVAVSKVPIEGSQTLVYGSADGGETVKNSDSELGQIMYRVGQALNLAKHAVGADRVELYGPGDLEVHLSKVDNRYYILDLARLFPPEHYGVIGKAAWVKGVQMYRLLRPELVATSPFPLSSDALTGWQVHDPNKEESSRQVRLATARLIEVVIPSVARSLINEETAHVVSGRELVKYIHLRGVNCRHMGTVVNCLMKISKEGHPSIKLVWSEILARSLRKLVQLAWRRNVIHECRNRLRTSLFKESVVRLVNKFRDSSLRDMFDHVLSQFFYGDGDCGLSDDVRTLLLRQLADGEMLTLASYDAVITRFVELTGLTLLSGVSVDVSWTTHDVAELVPMIRHSDLVRISMANVLWRDAGEDRIAIEGRVRALDKYFVDLFSFEVPQYFVMKRTVKSLAEYIHEHEYDDLVRKCVERAANGFCESYPDDGMAAKLRFRIHTRTGSIISCAEDIHKCVRKFEKTNASCSALCLEWDVRRNNVVEKVAEFEQTWPSYMRLPIWILRAILPVEFPDSEKIPMVKKWASLLVPTCYEALSFASSVPLNYVRKWKHVIPFDRITEKFSEGNHANEDSSSPWIFVALIIQAHPKLLDFVLPYTSSIKSVVLHVATEELQSSVDKLWQLFKNPIQLSLTNVRKVPSQDGPNCDSLELLSLIGCSRDVVKYFSVLTLSHLRSLVIDGVEDSLGAVDGVSAVLDELTLIGWNEESCSQLVTRFRNLRRLRIVEVDGTPVIPHWEDKLGKEFESFTKLSWGPQTWLLSPKRESAWNIRLDRLRFSPHANAKSFCFDGDGDTVLVIKEALLNTWSMKCSAQSLGTIALNSIGNCYEVKDIFGRIVATVVYNRLGNFTTCKIKIETEEDSTAVIDGSPFALRCWKTSCLEVTLKRPVGFEDYLGTMKVLDRVTLIRYFGVCTAFAQLMLSD